MHLFDTRVNFRHLHQRRILVIALIDKEVTEVIFSRLKELIPRGDFTVIYDVNKLKIEELPSGFEALILLVPQILKFFYWELTEILNEKYKFHYIIEIDKSYSFNDNFLKINCTQPINLEGRIIDLFGPMKAAEGEFLYRIAQEVLQSHFQAAGQPANIVEIGSYHGKSTACFAQAVKTVKSGNLFAVDKKLDQMFYANMKKYDLLQYVKPVEAPSKNAAVEWAKGTLSADKNIHLLFIDGDHTYQGLAEDFDAWERFVVPGGWILFHDYGLPGVVEGVYQKVVKSPRFTQFGITETIFTVKKQ